MSDNTVSYANYRPGSARRNFIILFLLLVCAALFSTIIYLDQRLRSEHHALTLLQADEASEIEIRHAGEALTLTKKSEGWVLEQVGTETPESLVDQTRVAPLLSLLQLPSSGRYNISDVDLQSLGLTDEASKITINEIAIFLGKPASGKRRYVLVNDTVFLAPDIAYPMISAGAQVFLNSSATTLRQSTLATD